MSVAEVCSRRDGQQQLRQHVARLVDQVRVTTVVLVASVSSSIVAARCLTTIVAIHSQRT